MTTVRSVYQDRVEAGLRHDQAQEQVIAQFDRLSENLRDAQTRRSWLASRTTDTRGVYLWGDVGRGKSMLVDMFLTTLDGVPARRTHFHSFMRDIHQALHLARASGTDEPVAFAADKVTKGLALLALDELEITDIVDAMIVGRVFERIVRNGVTVVATSNRHPSDLYQDGLKRELFLPTVALIEQNTTILHLDAETDYRRHGTFDATCYLTPDGGDPGDRMDAIWRRLTDAPGTPVPLARTVTVLKSRGCVRASFYTLCQLPLAASDYMDVARMSGVLLLDDVPRLVEKDRDAVRRFILLIDTLYDQGCGLVMSAAAPPDDLSSAESFEQEFKRTVSRLHEMNSPDWPGRPKIT